jgi:hypothetical protein
MGGAEFMLNIFVRQVNFGWISNAAFHLAGMVYK